jgi:hypothetical protein
VKDEMTAFERAQLALLERQIAATEKQTAALEILRPQSQPLAASDPRTIISQVRAAARANPHDIGEVAGELAWQDRTNVPSHPGTGSIVAKGRVRVRYDRTKDPRGLIFEVVEEEGSAEPVIEFLGGSFRREKDEAYRLSTDSPEHLAELEKQRVRYIQQNLYYRFRLTVLNALVGKTLEDPEVRMIFTPDERSAEAAAE